MVFIDGMTAQMVKLLLESDRPVSTGSMADSIAVSQSCIKNHLKDTKKLVESVNGRLINKPGVGILLEISPQSKRCLRDQLNTHVDHSYFYYFRKKYILDVLFSNMQNYTIQMFADDLYVGKNVIIKDLQRINQWLGHFELKIVRRKHRGIVLSGNEADIRQAIMANNRDYGLKEASEENTVNIERLDYRLREGFYHYLTEQYKDCDILELQNRLLKAEEEQGYIYEDEVFESLIEYLAIVKFRVRRGCLIHKNRPADDILNTPEYEISKAVYKDLKISENPYEAENFAAYLLVFKSQQEILLPEQINEEINEEGNRFIRSISEMMGIPLEKDQELTSALSSVLKRFRLCNRYGIHMKTTFSNEIKKNNSKIYAICISAIPEIETTLGFVLNDSEVAEIAMLVCNAVDKCKRPVKAVLVTASDYHLSKYIANRIASYIPELQISRIVLYDNANKYTPGAETLVLSTVPLPEGNAVLISKMVNTADIGRIQKALLELKERDRTDYYRTIFEQIADPEMIVADCNLKTRAEIIKLGCSLLRVSGRVADEFEKSALDREVFSPTAIGNGVAIPHGRQELIDKCGIAVIRLRKPVEWTDDDRVDIVFVLALKFDDKSEILSFFGKFYTIIENPDLLDRIRKANSREDIWRILMSFGTKECLDE